MKYSLIALIILLLSVSTVWAGDSATVKVIAGKKYIIHKIEKGETLYAVSRKYNVPIAKIFEANPGVKDNYNVGDEIKIPLAENTKTVVKTKTAPPQKPIQTAAAEPKKTPNKIPATVTPPSANENKTPIYHNVTKGETIFKIAKNHKMTVASIIKLNHLKSNSVEVGQMLIVGFDKTPANTTVVVNAATPKTPSKNTKAKVTDEDITAKYQDEYNSNKQKIAHAKPDQVVNKEVVEEGVASWFDDGSVNVDKSLALHSTAPIGTIIKLTNLINHKVLFVKVIGRPDKTDNQNVVLKITKSAADKLGVLDKYFRVEMHYMVEIVN